MSDDSHTNPEESTTNAARDWKVDANEYLKANPDPVAFRRLLDSAPRFVDYLMAQIPDGARGDDLLPHLYAVMEAAAGQSELERARIIDDLKTKTKVNKPTLRKMLVEQEQRAASSAEDDEVDFLKRGDQVELAQRLIADLGGPDVLVFDQGAIHRYYDGNGIWEPLSVPDLNCRIGDYAGKPILSGTVVWLTDAAIRGVRLHAEDRLCRPDFFATKPAGFAFQNGFVHITKDGDIEVVALAPEQRSRFRYPFDYDPDAKVAAFSEFLMELFRYDSDRRDRARWIMEFFGAHLIGEGWRAGVALACTGEGNDGKSTLAEVMNRCYPPGSVSAVSPHDWGNDYKLAMLPGSLLNVCGELSAKELRDVDRLKAVITGRDSVTARHPYERPFTFRSTCGHVMIANTLPPTSDQTRGFWRRWEVLEFTRAFLEDEEVRDIEELVLKEQQGIVAALIQAAARFVANGYKYTAVPSSCRPAKQKWQGEADAVRHWIETQCDVVGERKKMLAASMAFPSFDQWRQGSRFQSMSVVTFGKRIKSVLKDMARSGRLACLGEADQKRVAKVGVINTDKCLLYPLRVRDVGIMIDDGERCRVDAG